MSQTVTDRLVTLFREVTGEDGLGAGDDFFDHGDSILAARLIMRVRAEFARDAPLSAIFEGRTPAGLARLLTGDAGGLAPIPAARRPARLSFAQERLWFLHQLDPGDPAYNEPLVYRVKGELDLRALRWALRRVVARHEALRTDLVLEDDVPVQRVRAEFEVECEEEPGFSPERLVAEIRRPFDLGGSPLVRGRAFRVAGREWVLLFTLHHAVTDGWANMVFLRELATGYRLAVTGAADAEPPLAAQFSDVAAWERQAVGETAGGRLEQWAEILRGVPGTPALRPDRPRRPRPTHAGDEVLFDLEPRLAGAARALGVSTFTYTLAVFTAVLHRWTSENDLVVGIPSANRPHPDTESMIGFFVNTLPIRSRYDAAEPFTAFLGRLDAAVRRATALEDVPFEQVIRTLGSGGSGGFLPLVQVMFAFQNTFDRRLALEGLDVEMEHTHNRAARFEMTMFVTQAPSGVLECELEYNTDLFDRSTAERFVAAHRTVLDGVLADPHRPVGDHDLLPAGERDRLRAWNRTEAAFPDVPLHTLIEARADERPDAVAVACDDGEITYAELDQRANHLAHRLRALGVGPDAVVAVCLDRSIVLVAGLLAVLKAGGAYLPLDPATPRLRLDAIAAGAGARWCLTSSERLDAAPQVEHVLCLDALRGLDTARPDVRVEPEHLVSLYSTSGSTGTPKAVASTHRGWVNRMAFMQRHHGLRPGETVLHKTTLTFDDSALELFWPLIEGGRIWLIAPDLHRDPRAVLDAAARSRTVHLQVVPSMLAMIVDALDEESAAGLDALRTVVSSGEALSGDLARRFREALPGVRLDNTWGATEVSIDSTTHTAVPADFAEPGAVSLGRPFDNNEIHVLDGTLAEVPIGVTGDLYIAGTGLARGYAGDPAKTAAAFLPHPFRPGERIYRTGDRGHRREDGSLMFAGRTDHQVKIRGMRVELGEIEAVLAGHPGVSEAVAVVSAGRVVGYVTGDADPDLLRQRCADWLPSHMRPVAVLALDRLPLTPNGKVDRAALPSPDMAAETDAEPPRGPVEEMLAGVWAEVLGVDRVGSGSQFFELGGHSLAAALMVNRLRRELGLAVPVRSVFLHPVLRDLAAEVEDLLLETGDEVPA
ncbi:non-ribosomal peptide synthetase [Herbidospora cretacea]|uniref:non-ribosomal peptide synthetase n=1 Tax=Herbidospora cretacea TaxID=28444 RepID=UPI0009EEECCA|nr:non-ribosomal peptide synthetase [Herbidospora cretacea]